MYKFANWLIYREALEGKNYRIYCDLDGVFVDLNRGIKDVTGMESTAKGVNLRAIVQMRRSGYPIREFFANLNWTPDGRELWNFLLPYDPWVLTGGSDGSDIKNGKLDWCEKNLGLPSDKVIVESNKAQYANPSSILIDDYEKNVNDFIAAGGIGIHHTNTLDTISKLKEILK